MALPSVLEECVLGVEENLAGLNLNANVSAVDGKEKLSQQTVKIQTPQAFWEYVQKLSLKVDEPEDIKLKLERNQSTESNHYNSANVVKEQGLKLSALDTYIGYCDALTVNLERANEMLSNLESQHMLVSEKTNSLHETCKKLLAEQNSLDKVVSEINAPLKYLEEVDRLGPMLGLPLPTSLAQNKGYQSKKHNSSGGGNGSHYHSKKQVSPDSEEFTQILSRLDECIQFVEENPHFRDYEEYSVKFHQLYVRGLSILRNHICEHIRKAVDSAAAGVSLNARSKFGLEGTTQYSLLYVRFQVLANELKPQITLLEERTDKREAVDLLVDCHRALCNNRLQLLRDIVASSAEINASTDLITKLRVGCPYLVRVCLLEYQLFCRFFSPKAVYAIQVFNDASTELTDSFSPVTGKDYVPKVEGVNRDIYGEAITELSSHFYDIVRPLIIAIGDMDRLCACVRIIEGEILEAQIVPMGNAVSPFKRVVERILGDVQERLIYCTSMYIQDNIAAYTPSGDDLDYPGKLIAENQNKNQPNPEEQNQNKNRLYSGWYPTLENTLMCLSKVFRCVEGETFDELTQEAIVACTESLMAAAKHLANSSKGSLDSELFLVKHLLVLREQITPFNTELRVKHKHLDYSATLAAFNEFISESRGHMGQLFRINRNNPLVGLVSHGVPTIQEDEIDCKQDLEGQLRQACDAFILRAYEQCLVAVIPFLQRCETFNKTCIDASGETNGTKAEVKLLRETDFGNPARVISLLDTRVREVPDSLRNIHNKMKLYLTNNQTHAILFQPIKTNTFAGLTKLQSLISTHYQGVDELSQMLDLLAKVRAQISQVGTTLDSNPNTDGDSYFEVDRQQKQHRNGQKNMKAATNAEAKQDQEAGSKNSEGSIE